MRQRAGQITHFTAFVGRPIAPPLSPRWYLPPAVGPGVPGIEAVYLTKLASLHRVGAEASVLVNALSGAVDLVDNELRSKLLGLAVGVGPALGEEVHRALIERQYLLDSERAERATLSELHQAYRRLAESRPLQLVLALAQAPNLICPHCLGSAEAVPEADVMTPQQVRDAFSAIAAVGPSRPHRVCHIALRGDVSLLPAATPAVSEALACAHGAGLVVQTVTAGELLSPLVPLFARYPQVMRVARLTVDAPRAGAWDHVVAPVECCLEAGLEVSLCVTVGADDLARLPALMDLASSRGWSGRPGFQCQIVPAAEWGRAEAGPSRREDRLVGPVLALWGAHPELRQQWDFQFFRALHHLVAAVEGAEDTASLPRFEHCDVDRGELWTFGPDGLLYLCPESVGDRQAAVGSYSPCYRLWPRRLSRWEDRNVLSLSGCRGCNIATFCGGGCAYAALRRFGSPAHSLCGDTPEVVKAYFRHLPERLPGGLRLFASPDAH